MAINVAAELDFGVEVPEQTRAESGGAAVSEEWLAVAELLKDNAGSWAKVATTTKYAQASALAHRINTAQSKAFSPAHSYEAVSRKGDPVEGDEPSGEVYAKYVGEDVDPVKALVDGNDLNALKELAGRAGVASSGSKRQLAERIVKAQSEAQELPLNE